MVMTSRVLHNPLNGRLTMAGFTPRHSYEDAKPQKNSNYWSVTENNSNNAWNVNFGNGNVNNNNNKNNGYVVRPVAAYDGLPEDFIFSVREAYEDCLHGKMSSRQALEYMPTADEDLRLLAWELWTGSYRPTTSTCFIVKYPRLREVFAANFRDRIVHHWLCLRLNPLFEQRFISQGNVSYNCRKGFGSDAAVRSCANGIKAVSENYHRQAWVFKGDLQGFFMSIDKKLLWYMLERFINRWRMRQQREGWKRTTPDILDRIGMFRMPNMYWDILLATTRTVVMHHPEENCVLNSPLALWRDLPANKSLFTCNKDKGEPIGNLTTQLFANFLLSFFDQFVIRRFNGRNYSYQRFVDDWVIICDDKRFLLDSVPLMEAFLRDKLKLTMHKDKRYFQPVGHGLSFVGAYIKPGRTYLSSRTLARMQERAEGFRKVIAQKADIGMLDCMRMEQVINSYLGFCRQHKTYTFRKTAIGHMGNGMYRHFYVRGHYDTIRTRRQYRSHSERI